MKVLLIKDVYKLGRAGDLKRVADGYGRNFLLPQGLAVLATPGAIKQADYIREKATEQRAVINEEMGAVAEQLQKVSLSFAARAGDTGKLYGSITSQDVVDAIEKQSGIAIKRQIVDMQPLRTLGEHTIQIRLTMDLIPELKVLVYREGEAATSEAAVSSSKGKTKAETSREIVEEVINQEVEETFEATEELPETDESPDLFDETVIEE
ncbi:MAG TPA: 50S ribosomal protein L9 [Anaerolineales bacterium]|nr:50S ribosomal protein L9 [Anaerolineales bacterium]